MEKKPKGDHKGIGSRRERRKKFGDAISWDQYYKGRVRPIYNPGGNPSPKNVMSNEDRRKMGIEQDPSLPDFQGEK